MAKISDLKLAYQVFMKAYPYRRLDWRPGARLRKPLAQARVAVVTTAGLFAPGQRPFDTSIRSGDDSYRILDANADLASLRIGHRSDAFDIRGLESDRNLALPLDRLRSLVLEGVIGEVATRHFSFMGSIVAPGRLIRESAPEVARALADDDVDAILLTPV
jgi:D-proline reductase (dithiol) PrdB